jgi:hypothetical protein
MRVFIIILCVLSIHTFAKEENKDLVIGKKTILSKNKVSKYNFRKTIWGMNPKEVRLQEKGEPGFVQENALGYQKKLLGFETYVMYVFAKNKLFRAKYALIEKHSNKNSYISDFNTLKESLIKKYGKSKNDKVYWLNDLYKDDYSHWGMAISIGHLSYYTTWETDETTIILYLTGDNYQINLGIEYTSKKLEGLQKANNDNKAMEDL